MKKKPKAEFFTEITDPLNPKEGWNIVSGCCHCTFRRTKENVDKFPGAEGTCVLIKPPYPLPYVPCKRSKCPIKLRLLIDANTKQPFKVYSADKPTLWWRFKQWLNRT